jgi:hypothetical protein
MSTRRKFSEAERKRILQKTDGRCHLCHKTLYLSNYGKSGAKGAWEIDHSRAISLSGSDRLQNLYPACISCNRSKQARSNKAFRATVGYSRSPYSPAEKERIRKGSSIIGAVSGAALAAMCALSPAGVCLALLGGYKLGGHIANNSKVCKNKPNNKICF